MNIKVATFTVSEKSSNSRVGAQDFGTITCAQMPIINAHVGVSRGIGLHLHPFLMYERSISTGESAHMRTEGGV